MWLIRQVRIMPWHYTRAPSPCTTTFYYKVLCKNEKKKLTWKLRHCRSAARCWVQSVAGQSIHRCAWSEMGTADHIHLCQEEDAVAKCNATASNDGMPGSRCYRSITSKTPNSSFSGCFGQAFVLIRHYGPLQSCLDVKDASSYQSNKQFKH